MINVNNFKPGVTFIDDALYVVIETKHAKQARGQASVKAKVKNMRTGSITIKTYTGGDKLVEAFIDRVQMDFLYSDSDYFYFMDNETFEQVSIPAKKLEWEKQFLHEGEKVNLRMHEKEVLDVELPVNVELKVISSPDAVKGNTQSGATKKAIIETNFELEVPMFIKEGEKIIVSSETGKYVGRAK